MPETRLSYLFEKHLNGSLDQAESEELYLLSLGENNQQEMAKLLMDAVANTDDTLTIDEDRACELWHTIIQKTVAENQEKPAPVRKLTSRSFWWTAASIIILISASLFFWTHHSSNQNDVLITRQLDVPPGKEGAILTLADGSKVTLDSISNGLIVQQQGTSVNYKDGQVSYQNANVPMHSDSIAYNTITTPKGRQFQLILADGSRVWLNAGSSISYPVSFVGNERKVAITGEVYFEVAKDAHKPFRVHSDHRAIVEVLGTHFNINAYPDEASMKTTLLEGKVKVHSGSNIAILKPGEQAQVTSKIKIMADADIEKIMAWKNGYFNFEGLSLEESMRQLSRWYDIEVVYQGVVPDLQFFGEIGRDVTLNGLVKILKGTGLNFRIEEGKKLIVSK